jgi:hypothetical protein
MGYLTTFSGLGRWREKFRYDKVNQSMPLKTTVIGHHYRCMSVIPVTLEVEAGGSQVPGQPRQS